MKKFQGVESRVADQIRSQQQPQTMSQHPPQPQIIQRNNSTNIPYPMPEPGKPLNKAQQMRLRMQQDSQQFNPPQDSAPIIEIY